MFVVVVWVVGSGRVLVSVRSCVCVFLFVCCMSCVVFCC